MALPGGGWEGKGLPSMPHHQKLDLRAFRYSDDTEVPFDLIVLTTQFAEFSAFKLETLRLFSYCDRFPSGAPFFFALPSLQKLVLSFDHRIGADLSLGVQVLVLSGTTLMDGNYVSFPNLRVIKLYEVKCSNLLPRLSEVSLAGATTPLLWVAPTQTTSHFAISSPVLKLASFATRPLFTTTENGETEADAIQRLSVECLSTLFLNSPTSEFALVGEARLDGIECHYRDAHFRPPSCKRLPDPPQTWRNRSDRLHVLLPQLKWLDVYARGGHGNQKVNVMALARLAKKVKGLSPVRKWVSPDWKVTFVTFIDLPQRTRIGRPHYDSPTLPELRQSLRALLIALSPSQLDHLISSSLSLNSPPDAPPYTSVEGELLALGTPPPPPGSMNGFFGGLTSADGTGGDASHSRKRPQNKQKKSSPALPAPQNILDEARSALIAYQRRREQDWTIEWCGREHGLELLWGVADCWEPDCGCAKQHPGWEEGAGKHRQQVKTVLREGNV
ncbi:hypothetical protein JCM11251_002822 [Rhodosporidiobolus azoricus]